MQQDIIDLFSSFFLILCRMGKNIKLELSSHTSAYQIQSCLNLTPTLPFQHVTVGQLVCIHAKLRSKVVEMARVEDGPLRLVSTLTEAV